MSSHEKINVASQINLVKIDFIMGLPGGSDGKESACNARDLGLIPGSGRPLEKAMATHSSILAQRIPWTGDLVGYCPWGRRVGQDRVTNTHGDCIINNAAATEKITVAGCLLQIFPPSLWLDF